MERICFKTKKFEEAEKHDIFENIRLNSDVRQKIGDHLKERVYGNNSPDVRDTRIMRKRYAG